MMKSYNEWIGKPIFSSVVTEVIVEAWTGGSSRNWQRIGMLFGLSREPLKLNPFSKDTYKSWGKFASRGSANASDKGNEVLTTLEKAVSGEVPLDQLVKMAATNSPFRLCFNEAQSLKQKLTGKQLDAEETKWLLGILENFYSGGHINTGQLKMLWHSITGTPPNESSPKGNPKAIDWDVHSPAHLLKHFQPYGGHGIFSNPANYQSDIVPMSERIIRLYYPELANKLLGNYAEEPRSKKSDSGKEEDGGKAPPSPASMPSIENPGDLATILGKVDKSKMDTRVAGFINQILTILGKSSGGGGGTS